ncbi:MAG: hypothetical protein Q6354_06785 [Candidatus Brocadiales bacterium]|nr:hypothetical protein [Candidatus Brocadiales bacterium]
MDIDRLIITLSLPSPIEGEGKLGPNFMNGSFSEVLKPLHK